MHMHRERARTPHRGSVNSELSPGERHRRVLGARARAPFRHAFTGIVGTRFQTLSRPLARARNDQLIAREDDSAPP